jgi:large subunit ribosomal protein L47
MRARQTLSVREKDFKNQKLPTPVQPTSKVTGDPDHGLYDFFRDKKLLMTPLEESRHGMSIAITIGSSGFGLTMNQDEHGP